MNCRKAQRYILLISTGERRKRAGSPLDRHLRQCAACRTFDRTCRELPALVRPSLLTDAPSDLAMMRIRTAAADAIRKGRATGQRSLAPALAFVGLATIVVVAGIYLSRGEPRRARIEEIRTIVSLVHEMQGGDQMMSPPQGRTDSLFDLGQQLLWWEGLHTVPSDEETWLTGDDGLSPTALQWQSTRVPFARTCG